MKGPSPSCSQEESLSLEASTSPYVQERVSVTIQATSLGSGTWSAPVSRHREVLGDTTKTFLCPVAKSRQRDQESRTILSQAPWWHHGGRSTGTRETCFKLGELGKQQGTVKGRKEQTVRQKKGWGKKQTRTEMRSSGPNSSNWHWAGEAALAKWRLKNKQWNHIILLMCRATHLSGTESSSQLVGFPRASSSLETLTWSQEGPWQGEEGGCLVVRWG